MFDSGEPIGKKCNSKTFTISYWFCCYSQQPLSVWPN